jgi:uncharacterized protein YcbK (DUF882 family)
VRARYLFALVFVPGLAFAQPKAPPPAPKRVAPIPASRVWHTRKPGKDAPQDPPGRPMLVLSALNFTETVTIPALTDHGGFRPEDLDRAAHVLRDHHTGNEHPVDPRTMDLVYRLQVHFKAPEIRIISGYRTPRPGNNSNHGKGRAIDLVVPGATDEDVAKLAREQGFTGVGVYPVSGFVHVDIRERSYFWIDTSGPRQRSRIRGILGELAAKSDAQALARGEKSVGPFQVGGDVNAALAAGAKPETPAADDDDDVDTTPAP